MRQTGSEIQDFTIGSKSVNFALFEKEFGVYKHLVEMNGLNFQEVADLIRATCQTELKPGFTFIDLACGDSALMSQGLSTTSIAQYSGVDVSADALRLASHNLMDVPFKSTLEQQDMLDALAGMRGEADMIWCGLSVHHLGTDRKLEFMELARKALVPGGLLMIYEPVLDEDCSLPDFNARLLPILQARWAALEEGEFNYIWQHILDCDLPETAAMWLDLGLRAGYSSAEVVFSEPIDQYCRLFKYRNAALL
ncbi:class I SAM-dependent methyltransferase [Roseibium sp. RKSG952]|uniref:class I SAM-dependent methyltransferase n=1 Tax=Roseibium sp. RKSG952 TaxID=2529384 RepID=UPI0012BBED7C|nr:class I SAM-dependent methyltransferase [Roseibium sp. RKSG952]MTH99696.1 class I SAM-dependent methyltransferase [Roseibium sp. RKSG952]